MFGLRKRVKELERLVKRLENDVRENHYAIFHREREIIQVAKAAGLVWKESTDGRWERKNESA